MKRRKRRRAQHSRMLLTAASRAESVSGWGGELSWGGNGVWWEEPRECVCSPAATGERLPWG